MSHKQLVRVDTQTIDGNEQGREWPVHYALYETQEEVDSSSMNRRYETVYEIHRDDNAGNGEFICRGHNKADMTALVLELGEFVEWENPAKDLR